MIYMVEDMTVGEAIKRIKEFALHHAIQELPNSARTVEAFEMAITALEVVSKIVICDECRYKFEKETFDGLVKCVLHNAFYDADYYCGYGERKDGLE